MQIYIITFADIKGNEQKVEIEATGIIEAREIFEQIYVGNWNSTRIKD